MELKIRTVQCRKGSCRKILICDIRGFKFMLRQEALGNISKVCWVTMDTSTTAHGIPFLVEIHMNVLMFQYKSAYNVIFSFKL